MCADRDVWIGIQRKTFTRWANQYLPPGSKIEDLVADLSSGILLAKLLEKISEENVGKINQNPKMDIQKLENLNKCLDFVKAHNIPLVNVGSSDILKGNEKIILGLMWTIILRFEVAGADGKAGLLLWLQRSTKGYNGVNVQDFTHSWQNGLAFNALIHRYRPDLLNFDELSGADALGNCEKAFAIAENSLGITRLLDAEDVVAMPDEKSQVAYLSQFFKLFAGQAKLESKLKAIRIAVEVTRRHDEWISQYNAGSQQVVSFVNDSTARYSQEDASSSTDEVRSKLDEFSQYMKTQKPDMAAKRAECDGIITSISSSTRNNKRPAFKPSINPAAMNSSWEEMLSLEQSYERKLLDKYLTFQAADHLVSQFDAKSGTIHAWIDEKNALFAAGELGNSVSEIEANIELHNTYETRLGLYGGVVTELEEISAKAQAVQGHAGAAEIPQKMANLRGSFDTLKTNGVARKQALDSALEQERALMNKLKMYLHGMDAIDFTADQLEERLGEEISGSNVVEIRDRQNELSQFGSKLAGLNAKLAEMSELAQSIAGIKPEAPGKCQEQKERIELIERSIHATSETLQQFLANETRKDETSREFAELANAFAQYVAEYQQRVDQLGGDLNAQQTSLAQYREDLAASLPQKLEALSSASEKCEEAQVVANAYTTHTIYSLRALSEQLVKLVDRTHSAIAAQLLAEKSLEIPAEQLREMQEIFRVFDQDQDGKLRLSDLREACLGAGIDLEENELEGRMRARSPDMTFTIDDFIAFFIEEVKTGGTPEDITNAFKAICEGKPLTEDMLHRNFDPIDADLSQYLCNNIKDGDFETFTSELFSR